MKCRFYIQNFLISAFIFIAITTCFPKSKINTTSITVALSDKGYENLHVHLSADTIFIAYENRKYRWECNAIVDIIYTVTPMCANSEELHLVTQINGIPILHTTINIDKFNEFISGKKSPEDVGNSIHTSFDVSQFKKQFNDPPGYNTSFNKVDIVIHPQFRAQFGNYSDPLESQINIAPALNISFWKGMNLTTQIIFPLQNDIEKEGNYIRPGLLTIGQFFRLPYCTFASVTAGYFTKNRYGLHLETKTCLLNGKIAIGANCGYTGTANVIDGRWTYSEVDLITWFADIAYRWAKYDLTVKLGYGQFLNKDHGWRFDFYRQFGEVNIGFFAIKSNDILNGGFNFRIPIPPRKYSTKHTVRVRPASYFPWEYRAKGLPEEGLTYSVGSSNHDLISNLNPDYIKQQLINLISQNH